MKQLIPPKPGQVDLLYTQYLDTHSTQQGNYMHFIMSVYWVWQTHVGPIAGQVVVAKSTIVAFYLIINLQI